MSDTLSIKAYFKGADGETQVERFGMVEEEADDFDELQEKLKSLFIELDGQEVIVKYEDGDGDKLWIRSDDGLVEAVKDTIQEEKDLLKLYVEGKKLETDDGPRETITITAPRNINDDVHWDNCDIILDIEADEFCVDVGKDGNLNITNSKITSKRTCQTAFRVAAGGQLTMEDTEISDVTVKNSVIYGQGKTSIILNRCVFDRVKNKTKMSFIVSRSNLVIEDSSFSGTGENSSIVCASAGNGDTGNTQISGTVFEANKSIAQVDVDSEDAGVKMVLDSCTFKDVKEGQLMGKLCKSKGSIKFTGCHLNNGLTIHKRGDQYVCG